MKNIIFTFLILTTNFSNAQPNSELTISFLLIYDNTPVSLNDTFYKTSKNDSLQIEAIKFFVSQVELLLEKESVFVEENSYHLIDAASESSLNFKIKIPDEISFSHLKFNIGIDSLTNVSGAFGGDLDPTNGMYWTWQSGYINFKLEGTAEICSSRKNFFQFHLGGYQAPFNTLQNVELEIIDQKNIIIEVAIDQLLGKIDLEETYQVMSPNQKAVELAGFLPSIFSISK